MRNHGVTLVLGSGAARGFAHIGVLKALEEHNIPVDTVVGCSMGAFVGGFYAKGMAPKQLVEFARSDSWKSAITFFDPARDLSGIISGRKIEKLLSDFFGETKFEDLKTHFVAVATDILQGELIAISTGNVGHAIRASISVPGVFKPVLMCGRYLVDGAVLSPLPVEIACGLRPSMIIAVDVSVNAHRHYEHIKSRRLIKSLKVREGKEALFSKVIGSRYLPGKLKEMIKSNFMDEDTPVFTPRILDVIIQTLYIMQAEIVKAEVKDFPPDVIIRPDIDNVFETDFDKAEEIINLGEKAAIKALPEIKKALGNKGTCSPYPTNIFTIDAVKRWMRIPELMQKKILDNAFCKNCRGTVSMILETSEMVQKDLILRGKCKNCGKEVCRLVEPEPD